MSFSVFLYFTLVCLSPFYPLVSFRASRLTLSGSCQMVFTGWTTKYLDQIIQNTAQITKYSENTLGLKKKKKSTWNDQAYQVCYLHYILAKIFFFFFFFLLSVPEIYTPLGKAFAFNPWSDPVHDAVRLQRTTFSPSTRIYLLHS